MELLRVDNLTAFYNDIMVLKNVSFALREKEMVAIVGANASGKTTLLKAVSGLLRSISGRVEFLGKDITKMPTHHIVDLGLVQIPEGRKLFTNMTVLENLELGAYNRKARIHKIKTMKRLYNLFPVLKKRSEQLAGTLSGGEQQMLAIARGLMSMPELLILDEPSLGLAPIVTKSIFEAVKKETSDNGTTVLLVEQNIRKALTLSDRAYVLENGAIILEGKSKDLLNDEHVKRAYLGM
jgi:branched-chain amino acid transport system ATP-binding protein